MKAARSVQAGYAVAAALIALAVAFAAGAYVAASPRDTALVRERTTVAALALARDALIGRAAADDTRPGSLPCPDADNDGSADGPFPTHCTSYVGRLPWRTLGLPDVRDGSGERLWYVLSPAFRDHPTAPPINSDTAGAYAVRDVAGTILTGDAPALVISPGPVLGTQTREGANSVNVAMHLDGENADGDNDFVAGTSSAAFNDVVLVIDRESLFRPVTTRVATEIVTALERYRSTHGYYPAANPYASGGPGYLCDPSALEGRLPQTIKTLSPPSGCTTHAEWQGELPSWFFSQGWHLVAHYAVARVCASTDAAAGPLCAADAYDAAGTAYPGSRPLTIADVTGNARAVVIVTGPSRGTQPRPCGQATACIESPANADRDLAYVKPARWPDSNDRMTASCATASPCAMMP
jgi:hypothetical protein